MTFKFDIDDTILESTVDEKGNYHLEKINTSIIQKINKLYDRGDTIIIETGRHWNHLEDTIKQLKEIKIKYDTLIMGKPPVDYDIDDKNIRPEEFEEWII